MKISIMTVSMALVVATAATAQTRSVRDTTTAYGARLTAKGQPADLNQRRLNTRTDSRIDNRLSLRVERYRPDNTNDPTAAYRSSQDDRSRSAPIPAAPQQQTDDQ